MSPEGSHVIDVGEADFDSAVIERSNKTPVVVDFWAPWCGPCRVLGPTLEKLADELDGEFILAKVNVDEAPALSQQFHVQGIPAVKAFVDGEVAAEFTGALPEDSVREFLNRVIPSEAQLIAIEGDGLAAREPARAAALFDKALALEPGNERANLGLAELLLTDGELERVESLIGNIISSGEIGERRRRLEGALFFRQQHPEADVQSLEQRVSKQPNDGPALVDLGVLQAIGGDFEKALDNWIRAAEADKTLAETVVKDLMVRTFSLVGERSELADEYRSRLARLLY